MLHVLLRNKKLFLTSLAVIWLMIFLVPRIGSYLRNSQELNRVQKQKTITIGGAFNMQMKPTEKVLYEHAGAFKQGNLCLDSLDVKEGGAVGLWTCHNAGKNQFWFLLKDGLLKNKDLCLEGPRDLQTPGEKIVLQKCNEQKEQQSWKYDKEQLSMSGSELCLEVKPKEKQVKLTVCNQDLATQKWKLDVPAGM